MVKYQVIEKALGIMKTGKAQLVDAGCLIQKKQDRIAGIKINAETSEEIAVSIIARLIDLRRKNGASNICDPSGSR